MKIFLSYASQDRVQAEAIRQALAAHDYDIFFDREDLPAGEAFDGRIRQAIQGSDLFVALLSPNAIDVGSYTLSEVSIAQRTWKNPSGRVLPVLLEPVALEHVPAYLKSVTLLETRGNLAADVADAVHRLAAARRRRTILNAGAIVSALVLATLIAWMIVGRRDASAGKDGMPLVRIPSGTVTMGDGDWSPLREAYVEEFYIDMFEVTTARYEEFLQATGSFSPPDHWNEVQLDRDGDLPVIGVTWNDAEAYCRWAGRRLPTEAEWERAARSDDARSYPWGEDDPARRANFGKSESSPYDGGLAPVGSYGAGASALGAHDLAGNASEWVADWFADSFGSDEVRNPQGPASGEGKVIRGGGWHDPPDRLQSSRRFHASPEQRFDDVGFRCARGAV